MAVKTAEVMKTPSFSYRGFDIPALRISTELIADLGTSEPAYKLAPKSAPLAWKVGLYMLGRDLALGEEDAKALPEPIKQAGRMVYEDCQARTKPDKGSGAWHKDAVLFEPEATIKGSIKPGNDYIAARYFIDIEGFDEKTNKIKPSPRTREERIWVPKGDGWFIVPTKYGLFNPITGTPEETIADRGEALKRLADAGLAENELSRHHRGSSGTYAVNSWSSGCDGPVCVGLYYEPGGRNSALGSLALSRSAERSEAPKNMDFRLLTKAQYDALKADRKTLEAVKSTVNK